MITVWVIYDHPVDFPENWVVRAHDVTGNQVIIRKHYTLHSSLEKARMAIPFGLICFPRSGRDDPAIAESWI